MSSGCSCLSPHPSSVSPQDDIEHAALVQLQLTWLANNLPVIVQPLHDILDENALLGVFYLFEHNTCLLSLIYDGESSYERFNPTKINRFGTFCYRSYNYYQFARTADVDHLMFTGIDLTPGSSQPWCHIHTTDYSLKQTWSQGGKHNFLYYYSLMHHHSIHAHMSTWTMYQCSHHHNDDIMQQPAIHDAIWTQLLKYTPPPSHPPSTPPRSRRNSEILSQYNNDTLYHPPHNNDNYRGEKEYQDILRQVADEDRDGDGDGDGEATSLMMKRGKKGANQTNGSHKIPSEDESDGLLAASAVACPIRSTSSKPPAYMNDVLKHMNPAAVTLRDSFTWNELSHHPIDHRISSHLTLQTQPYSTRPLLYINTQNHECSPIDNNIQLKKYYHITYPVWPGNRWYAEHIAKQIPCKWNFFGIHCIIWRWIKRIIINCMGKRYHEFQLPPSLLT